MVHKQMILSFQDTSKVSLVFKWVIVNKFCIRDGKHVVLINNVEKPKTKTEVNKIQKFGYTKMCDNNILPENTSVVKKINIHSKLRSGFIWRRIGNWVTVNAFLWQKPKLVFNGQCMCNQVGGTIAQI